MSEGVGPSRSLALPSPSGSVADIDRGRSSKRSLQAALSIAFVLTALAFGTYALMSRQDEFSQAMTLIGWGHLGVSAAFSVLGVLLSVRVWMSAIRAVGGRFDESVAIRVFFATQLGKYLPGMVWPYLAQLRFAQRFGIPRTTMVIGQAVFLGVHVATGALLAGMALPWLVTAHDLPPAYLWLMVPAAASIGLLHPAVLGRLMQKLARMRGTADAIPAVSGAAIVRAIGWMIVVWLLYGASLASLVLPMQQGATDLFALSLGGFAFAWVIGFAVIIAPAGAGARELVLAAVLTTVMTPVQAMVGAVASRVVMTAADLVIGSACAVSMRQRPTAEPQLGVPVPEDELPSARMREAAADVA